MRYAFSIAIFLCLASSAFAQHDLKPGMKELDFTLPYATQDTINFSGVRLSNYLGKENVVLAFYPADWSSGCTMEMCTIRDNFSKLSTLHAVVLGISGDYVFTHHEWAQYQHLPIMLLSDHSDSVARMYNSFNPKNGFNKRTVFVINKEGKIVYEDMHYDPSGLNSFNKLREAVAKLG